jgi:hypothetical protein
MKPSTADFSLLDSSLSSFADDRTWPAAVPVSPAAWLTDVILIFTSSDAAESC